MTIQLNGKPHTIQRPLSVAELLDQLGLAGQPVVVELDRRPLTPADHPTALVTDGAQVEVVTLAAGG